VAKAAAFWEVANCRVAYNILACSGILCNHESPLRQVRFVTKKIVTAACRIAAGSREKLRLGNIAIQRDWGWAPEYVEAMWLMVQQEAPDDFVVVTGEGRSLEEFVATALVQLGLDWHEHVVIDPALFRPTEIAISRGNPRKSRETFGWQAKYKMPEVVTLMVKDELQYLRGHGV
jgi:GDPmannose 4,6-dehydratase